MKRPLAFILAAMFAIGTLTACKGEEGATGQNAKEVKQYEKAGG